MLKDLRLRGENNRRARQKRPGAPVKEVYLKKQRGLAATVACALFFTGRASSPKTEAPSPVEHAAARKAMEDAQRQVAASNESALAADGKAPLTGDNIKDTETEDAKLILDDRYADPAAQEAALPEHIADEEAAQ